MIKPIQSVYFYDVGNVPAEAFAEKRVAVRLGNNSGLGNSNDWCEVRTEPSNMALQYHVFNTPEEAVEFCRQFGTVTKLDADGKRRFDYIMRNVA